jgi:hypothetical protein
MYEKLRKFLVVIAFGVAFLSVGTATMRADELDDEMGGCSSHVTVDKCCRCKLVIPDSGDEYLTCRKTSNSAKAACQSGEFGDGGFCDESHCTANEM